MPKDRKFGLRIRHITTEVRADMAQRHLEEQQHDEWRIEEWRLRRQEEQQRRQEGKHHHRPVGGK
jgi:hypothetical protein